MDFVSDTFSGYKSLFVLCLQLVVRRAVVGDIYFGWQSVPHRAARETIWGSSWRPSYGSPSIQHRTRLHYYEAMLAILSSSKTHFFRTFRRTQWHSQEHWRCKCLILSFSQSVGNHFLDMSTQCHFCLSRHSLVSHQATTSCLHNLSTIVIIHLGGS